MSGAETDGSRPGELDPVMVTGMPPEVGPRSGLTLLTDGSY
jgi:hypothetical protein